MSKPKNPARQNKKGFVLPEPIPSGSILTDMLKKQWKIGPSIGKGGFGEIYSACENGSTLKPDKYPYVIKIEPHVNGPLFVEMHFYMRNAKKDDIESFSKANKLENLGMPEYIASGSHVLPNGNKYRFLVMQRFVCDLQSYLKNATGGFPEHTVMRLALQMIDVLEYIHSRTYVHADLKAANILLNSALNQAYLVDFGLASHYNTKEFKPDPKKMHNGTIEYTSRDAHQGVPTRRGDFEILAYNLIHWLGGILPWDGNLSNPVTVQNLKIEAGNDITTFLKKCFPSRESPKYLTEFVKSVLQMRNDAEPAYKKYRAVFEIALKASGKMNKGKFDFDGSLSTNEIKSPKKMGRPKKVLNESSTDSGSYDTRSPNVKKMGRSKKELNESPEETIDEPKTKKSKSNKRVKEENGFDSDCEKQVRSPKVRTPSTKPRGDRLAALKKRNDILEYSICDDEDVEIIVKKTNVKTGVVRTTIKTTRSETVPQNIRQSPRIKKVVSSSSSDLNSSNEENEKTNNRKPTKRAAEKTESKWKNCPTIKASKASSYLKKD